MYQNHYYYFVVYHGITKAPGFYCCKSMYNFQQNEVNFTLVVGIFCKFNKLKNDILEIKIACVIVMSFIIYPEWVRHSSDLT